MFTHKWLIIAAVRFAFYMFASPIQNCSRDKENFGEADRLFADDDEPAGWYAVVEKLTS